MYWAIMRGETMMPETQSRAWAVKVESTANTTPVSCFILFYCNERHGSLVTEGAGIRFKWRFKFRCRIRSFLMVSSPLTIHSWLRPRNVVDHPRSRGGQLEEPGNSCDSHAKIGLSNELPDDRLMSYQHIHYICALLKCFEWWMMKHLWELQEISSDY